MNLNSNYFRGEYFIAGLEQPDVIENLNWCIERYEKQWIEKLIGATLYADMLENPSTPANIAIQNMLFDANTLQSYCTNYVYYFYQLNAASRPSAIGEIVGSRDGEIVVSSADKMIKAYNDMVNWIYGEFNDWVDANQDAYPTLEHTMFNYKNSFGI